MSTPLPSKAYCRPVKWPRCWMRSSSTQSYTKSLASATFAGARSEGFRRCPLSWAYLAPLFLLTRFAELKGVCRGPPPCSLPSFLFGSPCLFRSFLVLLCAAQPRNSFGRLFAWGRLLPLVGVWRFVPTFSNSIFVLAHPATKHRKTAMCWFSQMMTWQHQHSTIA